MSSSKKTDPPGGSIPSLFADVPPSPPLPSGDYSYTVELVGSIQNQLGKLTEATDTLKEVVKEQGKKIDDVSKKVDEVRMDIHGAKSGMKVLMWVIGVFGTLFGLILAAFFRKILGGG